jgi:hypothetical protein
MASETLERIQSGINDRQRELHRVADSLASAGKRASRYAASAKVAVIVLGAISATREAANSILGKNSAFGIAIYTLVGLLTAVVGGIQAAFRFENRAAELRNLAVACQSTVRAVDTQWESEVGSAISDEDRVAAARKFLAMQDKQLTDIQQKAATFGLDITFEVRDLDTDDDRRSRTYLA